MDTVAFAAIEVDPSVNARRKYAGIDKLAEDIKANGLINPLTVFQSKVDGKNRFQLRAGFRRYQAIALIRESDPSAFKQVPVAFKKGNDLDATFVNLAENIRRNDLTPGEIAECVYGLTLQNVSQSDISKRIGLSNTYISSLIRCRTQLDPKVFATLVGGDIPIDIALKMSHLSVKQQLAALDKFLDTKKKNGRSAARDANGMSRPNVKKLVSVIDEIAESKDEDLYWSGVVHGLEFATGKRKNFSKPKIKR